MVKTRNKPCIKLVSELVYKFGNYLLNNGIRKYYIIEDFFNTNYIKVFIVLIHDTKKGFMIGC
jgi:hypothetical protein